jgi:hypothetical protein
MSYTTKSHMKKSIAPFAVGAVEVIRSNLNLCDKPLIVESEGSNWYLHKSGKASFLVKRQNYTNMTELPKGSRVYEEAVVRHGGKSGDYRFDGFGVHGYIKRAF